MATASAGGAARAALVAARAVVDRGRRRARALCGSPLAASMATSTPAFCAPSSRRCSPRSTAGSASPRTRARCASCGPGESAPAEANSVWCRRAGEEAFRFELLLDSSERGEWTFRRDPRVRLPLAEIVSRTRRRLPVPAARGAALVQGQGPAGEGRGGFRGGRAAPRSRRAALAARCACAHSPRARLARGAPRLGRARSTRRALRTSPPRPTAGRRPCRAPRAPRAARRACGRAPSPRGRRDRARRSPRTACRARARRRPAPPSRGVPRARARARADCRASPGRPGCRPRARARAARDPPRRRRGSRPRARSARARARSRARAG